MAQFAVFVDLENVGCRVHTLQHIIEKVKIRGDIFLGKVYGYTEHFADLNPVLLQNTFNVVPSIRYGGRQKNNMDIQLVIDALEVAYVNPLIDCVCIVSGDSDYTPLVGKLKSMGKFVLGISRSECASEIFINACNEFIFLEKTVRTAPQKRAASGRGGDKSEALAALRRDVEEILSEQADAEGWLFASELKSTLLRLRPDFSEKSYGAGTFGKLLSLVEQKAGGIRLMDDNNNLKVRLAAEATAETPQLTRDNFIAAARTQLTSLFNDGFERINPSVLKDALSAASPEFDEKALGFKKFSDFLKRLEKEGIVAVEKQEDGDLLVRIIPSSPSHAAPAAPTALAAAPVLPAASPVAPPANEPPAGGEARKKD